MHPFHQTRIPLWAFFFGLIVASVWIVGKQIPKWSTSAAFFLIVGIVAAWIITSAIPVQLEPSLHVAFFSGMIAICAMILPGISGSFILVLLGMYATVLAALKNFELGFILVFAGRYEEAISCFDQAIRLSPNDPSRWNFYLMKGIALYGMENFEAAIACQKEAARQRPTAFWPLVTITACLSALNRMDEARISLAETLKRKPDLSMRYFSKIIDKFSNPPNHLTRWVNDLSKAGLPD